MAYSPANKPIPGSLVDYSHPFCRGRVGHWLFNERAGGMVRDLCGNRNNGTWAGTGDHWSSSAGQFNGISDCVSCPSGMTRDPMTIAWVMYGKSYDVRVIFMDRSTFNGSDGIEIWTDGTNLGVRGAGSTLLYCAADWWEEWVHACVVYNGTTATIYRNGKYGASGTVGQVAVSSFPMYFGRYGGGGYYFNGLISEVSIYNRAFSAGEVSLLFLNSLTARYEEFPNLGPRSFYISAAGISLPVVMLQHDHFDGGAVL